MGKKVHQLVYSKHLLLKVPPRGMGLWSEVESDGRGDEWES